MKNMSLEKIAQACGGVYHGSEEMKQSIVESITTDSRQAAKGCLFVAIPGERVDGHDFIPSVFEKGALAVLSEKELENPAGPYIQVASSLEAVKGIAEYYRQQLDIKVVGITGSVGKTSTKEVIASVLAQKYNVLKTLGNFNNELGLPLTVFRLRDEHQIAVLEMGISHFGEMHRLAKVARPDICVITNIHADGESIRVTVPIPGGHMVLNALAATAVGRALGLTMQEIKAGIEALEPVGGRFHIINHGDIQIIDDCYNANPVSMKASLDVLRDAKGRKVAILGDMGELGENEEQMHAEVGYHAAKNKIDLLICTGKISSHMAEAAMANGGCGEVLQVPTMEALLTCLPSLIQSGDTVLVKASHFMHFEKVVEKLCQL